MRVKNKQKFTHIYEYTCDHNYYFRGYVHAYKLGKYYKDVIFNEFN